MSLICAVDPGLRGAGLAIFDAGTLVLGCYVVNPERVARGPRAWSAMAGALLDQYPLAADHVVVEMPQFDGRTWSSGSDIFEVVGVVGVVLASFAGRTETAMSVTPGEWAGLVPKTVRHARLMAELSFEEKKMIEGAGALTHNTLDAVALGIFAAKQLGERLAQ